ncbi:PREDICTED: uncharacterized protein LOC106106632 [Papilio polytes]|uniref:uncharacterized protein LOC106106632 n=1 Tax=Papilio polytes TaxID=76194 RepID=UPI000675DA75|nr:PREDICTED: uncharacterized protein LOC106106632 [Papilio polytes]
MAFILKSLNLYKFYKKNLLENVIITKVKPLAFISTEDSSETVPLPNLQRLSNRKFKKSVINNFCVPTSPTCESVLAGNPQAVDRRELLRQDIVNKWEQKTKMNPKNNSTILLGIALFGEIHKN